KGQCRSYRSMAGGKGAVAMHDEVVDRFTDAGQGIGPLEHPIPAEGIAVGLESREVPQWRKCRRVVDTVIQLVERTDVEPSRTPAGQGGAQAVGNGKRGEGENLSGIHTAVGYPVELRFANGQGRGS